MYSNLKICIIGDGVHSKRLQNILIKKKLKFEIYKPKKKGIYNKQSLKELKKFNTIFIISPDYTHFDYIKKLNHLGYIFCEKPPCTDKKQLSILKKIKSRKIYYNYNFRFSEFYQTLKNKNKFNLGKLLYGNIIYGHALGLKKVYSKNWRSKKEFSKKGILEVVTIHFIDIINNIFKIKNFKDLKLNNISKYGNSYDNSFVTLTTKENATINIFNSWTSELIRKKIFIFENGSIEENEKYLIVRGPALNLDKNNFTKVAKIIKKVKLNSNKTTSDTLNKSVDYFLKISSKEKYFKKDEIAMSLHSNSFII